MKLNEATTCSNTPLFVRQILDNLKEPDISEAALKPRYDDLLTIKAMLKKSGGYEGTIKKAQPGYGWAGNL